MCKIICKRSETLCTSVVLVDFLPKKDNCSSFVDKHCCCATREIQNTSFVYLDMFAVILMVLLIALMDDLVRMYYIVFWDPIL